MIDNEIFGFFIEYPCIYSSGLKFCPYPHFIDDKIGFNWFCQVVIQSLINKPVFIFFHRICRHSNDRGENIQVMRALALERGVKLSELNKVTAAILRRHAARLAKWNLKKTVALFEELARYFERQGPKNAAEFVEVTEAALVAIDRINAWIDAMIPWSQLDKRLKVNKPPA